MWINAHAAAVSQSFSYQGRSLNAKKAYLDLISDPYYEGSQSFSYQGRSLNKKVLIPAEQVNKKVIMSQSFSYQGRSLNSLYY